MRMMSEYLSGEHLSGDHLNLVRFEEDIEKEDLKISKAKLGLGWSFINHVGLLIRP